MKKKLYLKDLKLFFKGKRVVVTGHTGFKGSWLCLTLKNLGAKVYGYSLKENIEPNNFKILKLNKEISTTYGDVRNKIKFTKFLDRVKPQILFHLAAQSLVKDSYRFPYKTFSTNIIGTLNILEYSRFSKSLKSVVIITSDKCYKNKELKKGYSELDELGGEDPYSASKASAENIFYAYNKSFFIRKNNIGIATARAGNVIGGGDWSIDRIIPDCIRSITKKKKLYIRNPLAIRPWQHVMEPISGYIKLSLGLYKNPKKYRSSWNFGPKKGKIYTVEKIINIFLKNLKIKKNIEFKKDVSIKETITLQLKCEKSKKILNWKNIWDTQTSINRTSDWYKVYLSKGNIIKLTNKQINDYLKNGI